MTLKLRIALYLAIAAGILTFLVTTGNTAQLTTIFYRTLVSIVLFGIFGYTCGEFAEHFLRGLIDKSTEKGQKIDIVSPNDTDKLPVSEFKPLNPDSLENITLTQK